MFSIKGIVAVLITIVVVGIPLYHYRNFLTQGMRPPEATIKLNDLEKTGVPDFSLPDMDGKTVKLSDFRGKLVLVNIWATWCAPCVKEFPSLKGLVEKMDGRVVVLAVSHDKNREDIETFVKAFGAKPDGFVIVWDQERMTSKLFGTNVLPETYIVTPEGKLMRKVAGETTWDDAMALQFFKTALGMPDPHHPAQ